jgi:hypothetical protein
MAGNDQFRILIGGASDAGYVEIATADNGTEPIYVRQYTGTFNSLTRTATLLDASGNTSFPGTLTATTLIGTLTNTLTAGSYLTGTSYNNSSAVTFAVDATTTNTANKVVARDGNGDIYFRYGFSEYVNMSHSSSTRTTDTIFYSSTDNYIRKNDATGFRTSLNVPTRTGGDASGTWSINITGNSATVTNGFYTTSSFFLGTTSIPVNRASAAQTLNGVSISGSSGSCTGNAATVTNGFYTTSSFFLGTTTISVNRASAAQTLNGVSISGSSGSCLGNAATVTNGFYTTSSFFLGTTSIPVNRASAAQTLNGVSISGSSGSCTGNAASATVLASARNINGVSFDGSQGITITANTPNTLTRGTYLTGGNFNGSGPQTWSVDATPSNLGNKVVARDSNGDFNARNVSFDYAYAASSNMGSLIIDDSLYVEVDLDVTNIYTNTIDCESTLFVNGRSDFFSAIHAYGRINCYNGALVDSGLLYVGSRGYNSDNVTNTGGGGFNAGNGGIDVSSSGQTVINANRSNQDGTVISIRHNGSAEGSIATSGSTVQYNTFLGSHWGRLEDNSKPEILPGTIMETVDKLITWLVAVFYIDGEKKVMAYNADANIGDTVQVEYEGNTYDATIMPENNNEYDFEKNLCVKISDMPESSGVYGVFVAWDNDIDYAQGQKMVDAWNDMNVGSVGNYVVRMNPGEEVQIGDLVVSAGNGCGMIQSDDIIRSKTVAKITSTIKQKIYDDGSFLVTCVLYCG